MAEEIGKYVLPIMPSFEGGIRKIDKDLGKAFGSVSKSASKALSDGLEEGVKSAEAAVKKSADKIAALRDKEATATGKVRVAEEKLREVREKGVTGSQLARAEEAREKALRDQAAALRSVENETRSLKRAQSDLTDAQRRLDDGFRNSGGGMRRFFAGIDDEMGGLTSRFKSGGTSAGVAFAAGAGAAILAGGLLAIGQKAGSLVVDGFESVIDTGLDFSRTVNNFQGVTRATTQEMTAMQNTARALGGDTTLAGASASDAALAMTELAKAGFSIDEAMTAARGTLELATAGQIDAAKAAEIQSNAMNAFGLDATNAAHVADVLANAAIASSADIPDLGMALAQVGGIAHGFGENLDDTIAALGMFANAGIKGSDAGTLLKTTMQSITDQGAPAQEAIHQLGLELYRINEQGDNQFVGFRELFRQLDEAKRRLDDPEQFQALTNILFGSDAMRSAMLGNADAFDEMLDNLGRVGAASEMAEAQMQGLPGAVESWQNAAESVKLEAFDALGPALTTTVSQFADYLSEHRSEIASFFNTMGDAAFEMGKVTLSSFGSMTRAAASFADAVGADGVAEDLNFAADAMEDAFGALSDGQRLLNQYTARAEEAGKFTDALGDSMNAVKLVGDDITIGIDENTPEVQSKLDDLGIHLEAMADDPTTLRLVADNQEADDSMNAWRQQQQGTPIEIPFFIHYEEGQSFLPDWMKYIGGNAGPAPLPVQIMPNAPGAPRPGAPSVPNPLNPNNIYAPPRAEGGIDRIGPGAHIGGPVYPNGLVRYREPSTHGEAYIPLNGSDRSIDIWTETGRLLGIPAFEQGGIIEGISLAAAVGDGRRYEYGGVGPNFDCSGYQSAIYAAFMGLPQGRRYFTTESDFEALGFKPGYMPGAYNIGISRGGGGRLSHMAATLPNGVNAESGGEHNSTMYGGPAKGALDFPLQFYLPVGGGDPSSGGYGGSYASYGGYGGFGGGAAGGGGGARYGAPPGGTPGVDPETGESGYFVPDADDIRKAEQRVVDEKNALAIQEQQLRELKDDASESQRMRAEEDVRKAKEDVAEAERERDEARRGKFTKGKRLPGSSGGGGEDDMSPLGGILGSFFKETFGLDGSLFPDISNLMPIKMLGAALGAFKGPIEQAMAGTLGIQQPGWTPGAPVQSAGASGLPFGMIPSPFDFAGTARPGMAPPGTPASGIGAGAPPGPVDQSRHVNVQVDSGPSAGEIGNTVRREINNVDRLHTYAPKGFGG